ncbi:MAG: hypothetical protein R3C44_05400 [Chloroflexota bacterium]
MAATPARLLPGDLLTPRGVQNSDEQRAALRVLLLNRNTNEVGVGYYEDYSTAIIWHWTADLVC